MFSDSLTWLPNSYHAHSTDRVRELRHRALSRVLEVGRGQGANVGVSWKHER